MVILLESEKELFFVEIKQDSTLKRDVLEAQKGMVEALQRYQNIKFIRDKKIENVNKLRSMLKHLHKMVSELKEKLPHTKIKGEEVKKKKQASKSPVKKKEAVKKEKKPMTELQKLEAELNAIESKLGDLK